MSQQLYLIVMVRITLSIAVEQLDYAGFFRQIIFHGDKIQIFHFYYFEKKEDPLNSIQCIFNANGKEELSESNLF